MVGIPHPSKLTGVLSSLISFFFSSFSFLFFPKKYGHSLVACPDVPFLGTCFIVSGYFGSLSVYSPPGTLCEPQRSIPARTMSDSVPQRFADRLLMSRASTMSMTAETAAAVSTDPILAPNPQRFVLFPIKYHQVWEMYKKHKVRKPIRLLQCPARQPVLPERSRACMYVLCQLLSKHASSLGLPAVLLLEDGLCECHGSVWRACVHPCI